MKYLFAIFYFFTLPAIAEIFVFTPPAGWKLLHPQGDSRYITVTYVAPQNHYPPSLSLAHEPLFCTHKKYLDSARKLLERNARSFRTLGTEQTPAGSCTLYQLEYTTPHGDFSTLTAIYFSQKEAYTLSFAAKKSDFATMYPLFETAIRSGTIVDSAKATLSKELLEKIDTAKITLFSALPKELDKEPFTGLAKREKKVQKALTNFEKSLNATIGKENSVVTFHLLKEIIAEISASYETNKKKT